MDSETPLVDALTVHLVDTLTEALPTGWKLWDVEAGTAEALGIVLYYEQGDLVTTINGGKVADGYVGVEYTLTLTAPEKEPVKGQDRLNAAVLEFLPVLDSLANLLWDRAEKIRLSTGETAYRLAVVNLSSYLPNPEPDPEPDAQP